MLNHLSVIFSTDNERYALQWTNLQSLGLTKPNWTKILPFDSNSFDTSTNTNVVNVNFVYVLTTKIFDQQLLSRIH